MRDHVGWIVGRSPQECAVNLPKPCSGCFAPAELKADDVLRLRSLNLEERGNLIYAACEAAAAIVRGRAEAGLPPVTPAPWPASTWEFLKRHAVRVRT